MLINELGSVSAGGRHHYLQHCVDFWMRWNQEAAVSVNNNERPRTLIPTLLSAFQLYLFGNIGKPHLASFELVVKIMIIRKKNL